MSASPTSTHRSRSLAPASIALALLAAPATVVAQSPDRIDLAPAWQGEGITTEGSSLFAVGFPHVVAVTAAPTTGTPVGDDPWAVEYGITGVDTSDEVDDQTLSLPPRPGPSPSVTTGIPHIQQDQVSSPELMEALAAWAFSLPSITELPSAVSLPGPTR